MAAPENRHECRCSCECGNSAAGELCWLCADGIHRPPLEVRRVLFARLELWSRVLVELTPDSSSGISAAALVAARERYDVRARSVR